MEVAAEGPGAAPSLRVPGADGDGGQPWLTLTAAVPGRGGDVALLAAWRE